MVEVDNWEDDIDGVADQIAAQDVDVPVKGPDEYDSEEDEEEMKK